MASGSDIVLGQEAITLLLVHKYTQSMHLKLQLYVRSQ